MSKMGKWRGVEMSKCKVQMENVKNGQLQHICNLIFEVCTLNCVKRNANINWRNLVSLHPVL